jgi:hypothetical protein
MRNAIAAASVVMYLCMVGIVTYFAPAGDVGGVGVPVTGLTKDLVDSFRSTITVVVGFYFTSAAVVEGIQLSRGTAD